MSLRRQKDRVHDGLNKNNEQSLVQYDQLSRHHQPWDVRDRLLGGGCLFIPLNPCPVLRLPVFQREERSKVLYLYCHTAEIEVVSLLHKIDIHAWFMYNPWGQGGNDIESALGKRHVRTKCADGSCSHLLLIRTSSRSHSFEAGFI